MSVIFGERGGLAIARVPYDRYLRWVWPLLAMLAVLSVRHRGGGRIVMSVDARGGS